MAYICPSIWCGGVCVEECYHSIPIHSAGGNMDIRLRTF